jgi:hypothetical protein
MAQVTDEHRIYSNQSPYVMAGDDGTTPNCIRTDREKTGVTSKWRQVSHGSSFAYNFASVGV